MIRDITIKPALNGYIVRVGCQTVVFDDPQKLCSRLYDYLKNPEKIEAEYMKDALNPGKIEVPPPPPNCDCRTQGNTTPPNYRTTEPCNERLTPIPRSIREGVQPDEL